MGLVQPKRLLWGLLSVTLVSAQEADFRIEAQNAEKAGQELADYVCRSNTQCAITQTMDVFFMPASDMTRCGKPNV
jgi:hypothetical protein